MIEEPVLRHHDLVGNVGHGGHVGDQVEDFLSNHGQSRVEVHHEGHFQAALFDNISNELFEHSIEIDSTILRKATVGM